MSDTLPLEVDLRGRVGNMRLPQSNALYPLYEAVVNSIQAVLDLPHHEKGRITIRVLRSSGQKKLDGEMEPGRVIGFQIEDNGVGFNEANFSSFKRSDSTAKARLGGKGIGRLLWLKVFESIQIESVFKDGQATKKRSFTFTFNGIEKPTLEDLSGDRFTKVTLSCPTKSYSDALQHDPETIAIDAVAHCLEYLTQPKKPKIFLIDEGASFETELGKLFQDELKSEIQRDDFSIKGTDFRITHLLVRGRKNSRHALHFCAHSRRVRDESLASRISGLSGGLRPPGSQDDLAYQGYVSGSLLDQVVGAERASFDFDGLFPSSGNGKADEQVCFDELLEKTVEKARKFLEPTLGPILQANQERIRTEIERTYPQYRYLLKHRGTEVAAIPTGVEGKDLDLALYKIEQVHDFESREALTKELRANQEPDEPPEARRARLDTLLEQLNDSGMSKLARHIAYRRSIIEFLDDQTGLKATGKYPLEEAVHAAVCPTKQSSDDIPYSKMNLWLLDDRLYFHYYLSSDLSFEQMKSAAVAGTEDRPDIAIFQRPMAFSDSLDQIGAVVLVEFKRPSRDDHKTDSDDRNPVTQVLDYVNTLREGKAIGARGQSINIPPGTPFYAYIVADLKPTLRKLLTSHHDFIQTPDGDGYFKFHATANCYIEVMSIHKMIRDAKKRNQAFFDKLNIPFHR